MYHKAPFDRMFIAQALVEGLTIITVDEKFKFYLMGRDQPELSATLAFSEQEQQCLSGIAPSTARRKSKVKSQKEGSIGLGAI